MLDTKKLAALADRVEQRSDYDQALFTHCLLGNHYGGDMGHPDYTHRRISALWSGYAAFNSLYGTTTEQSTALFGMYGCGNAGKDAGKAAAFIRQFIAENSAQEELAA